MKNIELGEVQAAFADIIWEHEPVGSGELVKICERELGWKKPFRMKTHAQASM